MKPWVLIVMGSDSDAAVMSKAADALDELGVQYEMTVASAHRTPERLHELVVDAENNGARVFIAGAGAAAHLAGVVASMTIYPVIGVPLEGSPLLGLDALLAIVQMPGGMPVGSMAIGAAGARNGGIFAAQILATTDEEVARSLDAARERMRASISEKAGRVERKTTRR